MVECKYCDEEFDSKQEMHLHWDEEHGDELNSHDKEKVKKAKREKEQQKSAKIAKRRKMAGKALAVGGVLIIAAILGQQALDSLSAPTQTGSFDLDGQPMMGNADANVTVVEFGDYQCPYCRQFDQNTFPQLKENYIDTGEVKFYYVNFAFLGPGSTQAAAASECVYDQTGNSENFWNFHKAVFDNQGSENSGWVTTDFMMEIARNNTEGLDYGSLRQCIAQQETIDEVNSDVSMGRSNGVSSTPSIYVNGQKVPNQYSSIRAAIEQELQ